MISTRTNTNTERSQLLATITAGTPGLSLTIAAADLKEVVAEMFLQERHRIEEAVKAHRETPTLTRREVARLLKVSECTLWRWDKIGYLKPTRIGTNLLYRASDIDRLLTEGIGNVEYK